MSHKLSCVCLLVCLPVCPSIRPCLPACLSVHPSVCPSVCLSICPFVCLRKHTSLHVCWRKPAYVMSSVLLERQAAWHSFCRWCLSQLGCSGTPSHCLPGHACCSAWLLWPPGFQAWKPCWMSAICCSSNRASSGMTCTVQHRFAQALWAQLFA